MTIWAGTLDLYEARRNNKIVSRVICGYSPCTNNKRTWTQFTSNNAGIWLNWKMTPVHALGSVRISFVIWSNGGRMVNGLSCASTPTKIFIGGDWSSNWQTWMVLEQWRRSWGNSQRGSLGLRTSMGVNPLMVSGPPATWQWQMPVWCQSD